MKLTTNQKYAYEHLMRQIQACRLGYDLTPFQLSEVTALLSDKVKERPLATLLGGPQPITRREYNSLHDRFEEYEV